jgi:hypothetical protein
VGFKDKENQEASVRIDNEIYEQVFMVAPQLLNSAILGANFLNDFQLLLISKRNVLPRRKMKGLTDTVSFTKQ